MAQLDQPVRKGILAQDLPEPLEQPDLLDQMEILDRPDLPVIRALKAIPA
jgi:hypothetical protein